MKISVAKCDLKRALDVAKITVSGDPDLSGHYLFRNKGGKLEVMSYHQRVFSSSPVVATIEGSEGEAFTVEAWRLDKWVGGIADGVLTFTSDGAGCVNCSGPRSKVKLRSLDAKKFPFWDRLAESAKSTGTVPPNALSRALAVSRWFVSGNDTSEPEMCQIDSVKGVLWASDRKSISAAEVPGLENISIRIPGKDLGALVKFLTDKGTVEGGTVDIREATRSPTEGGGAALFYRLDGSYFGVSRPTTALPAMSKEGRDIKDSFTVSFDVKEFTTACSQLSSAAPKGYDSVTFKNVDGALVVSMPSEAGGSTDSVLNTATMTGAEKFTMSFSLNRTYIQGLVTTFAVEKLKLGCNSRGQSGYCAVHHFDEVVDEKAFGAIDEIDTVPEGSSISLDEHKKTKRSTLTLKGNRYFTVVGWEAS